MGFPYITDETEERYLDVFRDELLAEYESVLRTCSKHSNLRPLITGRPLKSGTLVSA